MKKFLILVFCALPLFACSVDGGDGMEEDMSVTAYPVVVRSDVTSRISVGNGKCLCCYLLNSGGAMDSISVFNWIGKSRCKKSILYDVRFDFAAIYHLDSVTDGESFQCIRPGGLLIVDDKICTFMDATWVYVWLLEDE